MSNIKKKESKHHTFIRNQSSYDEYLLAMKRVQRESIIRESNDFSTPRERYRRKESKQDMSKKNGTTDKVLDTEARKIGIIASMVPDEVILNHRSYSIREYEAALMFVDISGFTLVCERYTKAEFGGPSKLSQVLNSYIGTMVQEILIHGGDVLNFSGDAVLTMWKKTDQLSMQDVVHEAIDCGLIIQKNYGTLVTEVGITLQVKVAISAGKCYFSLVGDVESNQSNYVIIGQPVWDCKMAEVVSSAGDVLTSASAWMYVNETEYCTKPCADGRHTKVLGVGATWKKVETLYSQQRANSFVKLPDLDSQEYENRMINYREYILRPVIVTVMRSDRWTGLRRFMLTPVLRAVDNDEPMELLTEVRRVVIVCINVVVKVVVPQKLVDIINQFYKFICQTASEYRGLVNKVSMFDKDMMFLVVFGLRGLKYDDEARKALEFAIKIEGQLNQHKDIFSVSIGVTSGTTYCGVVGHLLRREYTVIGLAVNKAARLMMAYPDKVTCDKETFLRSKMDQEMFKLLEMKTLKGIARPGPIYECSLAGPTTPDYRLSANRPPIIGRNDELHTFIVAFNNALKQNHKRFTRYRESRFGLVVFGQQYSGKTRFLDECISLTPQHIHVEKFTLTEVDNVPYGLIRAFFLNTFIKININRNHRPTYENVINVSLNVQKKPPMNIHAINEIFDCRFPLPEDFKYPRDILAEDTVKEMLLQLCDENIISLCLVAVFKAEFMDDKSWRTLRFILGSRAIFALIGIATEYDLTPTVHDCINEHIFVKMTLPGIDRMYHATLACQLLDVQAIPVDLEKIIQSASNGLPGWIQNFVISLIQRGQLNIATVTRTEAKAAGAVVPPAALLKYTDVGRSSHMSMGTMDLTSPSSMILQSKSSLNEDDNTLIQMAVLVDVHDFENIEINTSLDAIILKIYDSLTPFEKKILKCGSVLGDVFSRRILIHLLQSDSDRTVAEAVARLFKIRVLECEGGDFTSDCSMVLIHKAPRLETAASPHCSCLGIRIPSTCRDLPNYAFCGYMKFKHTLFRTTTYDLLTTNQKQQLHARALLYVERFTQRCCACGGGSFVKMLGQKSFDGLRLESAGQRQTRLQMAAINDETKVEGVHLDLTNVLLGEPYHLFACSKSPHHKVQASNIDVRSSEELAARLRRSVQLIQTYKKPFPTFKDQDPSQCECVPILLSVYTQLLEHSKGAGEYEKLMDAYMEFTNLSIDNDNIPQALRLLGEMEELVNGHQLANIEKYQIKWMKEFLYGQIYSLRGECMLESGDHIEAKKQFFEALKLFYVPFPQTKKRVKLALINCEVRETLAWYVFPWAYGKNLTAFEDKYYDAIATTLSALYRLFTSCQDMNAARLSATLGFRYSRKSNTNFKLLCVSYGNMLAINRLLQKFKKCERLEKGAIEVCYRKQGVLDVTEIRSVCYLYTSVFLFYVECGKHAESLEFGLSVMNLLTHSTDMVTRQLLILWMLKVLLFDLRVSDMVDLMTEYLFLANHYDMSFKAWYYYYAMVILLDTGICVETYRECENFFIKKGSTMLKTKVPEAAWNFLVTMWLFSVRIGAWERTILWEERIKDEFMDDNYNKLEHNNYKVMILLRWVEGLLISLVEEIDNRNVKKVNYYKKSIKATLKEIKASIPHLCTYLSRYYLMMAYFNYIRNKRTKAYEYMTKATNAAEGKSDRTTIIWIEHNHKHWTNTLNLNLVNHWMEHIEPDNQLDKDSDLELFIVPFTLPLPKDVEHQI